MSEPLPAPFLTGPDICVYCGHAEEQHTPECVSGTSLGFECLYRCRRFTPPARVRVDEETP